MGTGKAGKAAKRNVGRGGKKVGGGKKSGAAGQVSLADARDSAYRAVTAARFGSIRNWTEAETWIMEQACRSYFHDPQTFRGYPSEAGAEAKPSGKNKVADEKRMGTSTPNSEWPFFSTRADGAVYVVYWSKGEQRP